MLRFSCPQCKTTLEFDDSVRGTVVSCHSCGGKFRVPAAPATTATPPPLPPPTASGPPPLPAADEPEDWPDLAPEPYEPDGGMAPAGSIVVLAICLLVGVLMGVLASFIGQWVYLILVFPVAIGFVVGLAGVLGVHLGKVRTPWWAGLVGFLSGCFAMATVHYVDYTRFQKAVPGVAIGFFEFVDLRAEDGVRIGRVRAPKQGGGGLNLGYVGSYIYWFVETLIVAVIAFTLMNMKSASPFCVRCNRWKKKRFLGCLQADLEHAAQAIETGNLRFLDRHRVPDGGNLKVEAQVCPECTTDGPFELQLYEANQKQQHQYGPLAQATYPGYGLPVLEELFNKRSPSET